MPRRSRTSGPSGRTHELRSRGVDGRVVRSIIEIGRLTDKQTIAEWAENAETIETLRGLGVDYALGYGVSQPQRVQRAAIA